jgi:hypothetical protein
VRRFHTEKLYHTTLETAPRFILIELQIRHLYMLLHRLMHVQLIETIGACKSECIPEFSGVSGRIPRRIEGDFV